MSPSLCLSVPWCKVFLFGSQPTGHVLFVPLYPPPPSPPPPFSPSPSPTLPPRAKLPLLPIHPRRPNMKRCLIKAHRRKRFRAKSGKKGSRGKKLARLDPAMQLGAHLQLHPVCTVHLCTCGAHCARCILCHPRSRFSPPMSCNSSSFSASSGLSSSSSYYIRRGSHFLLENKTVSHSSKMCPFSGHGYQIDNINAAGS